MANASFNTNRGKHLSHHTAYNETDDSLVNYEPPGEECPTQENGWGWAWQYRQDSITMISLLTPN